MRTFRYTVVDVFTDTPLAGNQLAVFTDGRDADESLMQALAREVNFAESVFVLPRRGDGHARLRIFTPQVELPFAGHPVLGTAFVLGAPLQLAAIRLETDAGIVPVQLEREGPRIVFGRMTQPVPTWRAYEGADELVRALGGASSGLPVELYEIGPRHVFVELPSADAVRAVAPDLAAIASLRVAANCFSRDGARWKLRVFLPGHGIAEDAATGSAAGPLAVHLCRHGRAEWGKEIEIAQGDEMGRPSRLYARADGSAGGVDTIEVGGSAVVVARGEFRLP